MNYWHTKTPVWGKYYRLSFWRWGVTLDWGEHRFILTIRERTGKGKGAPDGA